MIFAVAYTEYQLIQIQALVREYFLKDVCLITFKKNRIPEWLIDFKLYKDILWLPEDNINRYTRISKGYLDEKYNQIKKFIGRKEADILIGAQDENTIFALVKLLAKPRKYWSIEDGLANYYHRRFTFKSGIFFKKMLFNRGYGYKLNLSYGHGKVRSDESFRMLPELCIDEGDHKSSVSLIKKYINDRYKNNDELAFYYGNKYSDKNKLIISSLMKYSNSDRNYNNALYKFHPEEKINTKVEVDYIQNYVPIELLVNMLPELKTVEFDYVSSSILNLLCIYEDLNININFEYREKKSADFLIKLINKFPERIKIL